MVSGAYVTEIEKITIIKIFPVGVRSSACSDARFELGGGAGHFLEMKSKLIIRFF